MQKSWSHTQATERDQSVDDNARRHKALGARRGLRSLGPLLCLSQAVWFRTVGFVGGRPWREDGRRRKEQHRAGVGKTSSREHHRRRLRLNTVRLESLGLLPALYRSATQQPSQAVLGFSAPNVAASPWREDEDEGQAKKHKRERKGKKRTARNKFNEVVKKWT